MAFDHFPALETAGIKQVINGPFTFAPDGNPLVGPVRGLRNFWVACGVMAGFSQGGGVGLALSNWMVEGDPGFDVRSEEHTSELQSLMRISYAVFCLKKNKTTIDHLHTYT